MIIFESFTGTLEFQKAEGKDLKITTIDEQTSISSCKDIYDDSSFSCVKTPKNYTISGVEVRISSHDSLKVSLPNDTELTIVNQSLKGRVLKINLFYPTWPKFLLFLLLT